MKRNLLIIVAVLGLCACTKKDNPVTSSPDMSAVRVNLAFTCVHQADHLPPLDPEADGLFRYARYLEKKEGSKDFNDIARYYRIAAAHGHYKANQNLQSLLSEGLADSPDPRSEVVDLAMLLVKQDIPSGYYSVGHYLEIGYGLKQDSESALRYFRKAADLGNPEAQYYVGDKLLPNDNAPDIARQMLACAADQGFGQAASLLGVDRMEDAIYAEAIKTFQKGAAAGDSQSASFLEKGFRGPPESNKLYYLGLENDPERSRRYELIGEFIDRNDGRNPKVPDIDKIVPLPPAKLPPWDGTFQWQKEQDAAVPPQKPAYEVIDQMAKEKNLDPATGLPLATATEKASQQDQPQTMAERLPLGTVAHTGQLCPQDGVWCAKLNAGQVGDTERRFLKGDALPSIIVHEPRRLAVLDSMMGTRQHIASVAWELVAYLDQA
ncbi:MULTISPECIES: sel1 repeat family protein [unclassified Burkholderia]|uniref:SEL1-like repeat protein n=1 Tax=unclassified Burkholderia TaxID=2613784 RepID=UPI001E468C02|nr:MULTISPECIES: sel1 repeat family protein [unclassified Burkholderia]UEP31978.1 sel1 repeat family protein [Burkholderia sp. B21-007]UEP45434.1 sel1 repeat family protein [Burkholderia sp. B21-005]